MTDKSAAAVREFAEKIVPVIINSTVLCNTEEIIEAFTGDLTALIEEHYYPKDMVRWTFNQRFMACGHTGFDSSILELDLEYWNEHIKGKENEQ